MRRRPFFLQRQLWCEDGARENQLLLLPDGVGLFDGRVFEEKKGEKLSLEHWIKPSSSHPLESSARGKAR